MSKIESGFIYTVELVSARTGEVLEREVVHNLMPLQGRNHMLNVVLNGAAAVTQWYVLPYANDYTPTNTDTAATFPGLAGELTNYEGATRKEFVGSAATGAVVSNVANRAEFSFSSPATVRGGAIVSAAAKGSTSGVLFSAVRFASAKNVDGETILRILAGIELANAD